MKKLLAVLAAAMTLSGCAAAARPAMSTEAPGPGDDPFLWLEDVYGERAMAWVEAQNAGSRAALESDPRYRPMLEEATAIFTAVDRIPEPEFRGPAVYNFWKDAERPKGVWRRTTPESFATAEPTWETVLDVDALARTEGVNWVWKYATCLQPELRFCLVALSDGGKDAVTLREFDTVEKRFVDGGFVLPEGKQTADWIDRDTLILSRDWGPDTLTASGYAFVVKTLRRGETLDQAREAFRGDPTEVSASPSLWRDKDGRLLATSVFRAVTFFEFERWLLTDSGPVKLDFPRRFDVETIVHGRLVFTIKQDWRGFAQGSILAYDLAALTRDPAGVRPELVFAPGPRQTVESVSSTRNRLVVNLLEDVKGAVDVYDLRDGRWTRSRLPLPDNASFTLTSASGSSDQVFVTVASFLDPPSLWLADAAAGSARRVKSTPARFDASRATVEQFWATSKDGTRIPYFVVRPKDAPLDGANPTLLFGYGGFQVSKPPAYWPEMGKLWLERGGIFVNANIRGGGEFGPAWHQSVLRENRQKAFDDFAAVAEDLIRRGITSQRRLGIYGRSNGGVLTSVTVTQRPDLINAAVIESPLIDMMRYHKLPAGASWIAEYGDPEKPEDAAFLAEYSAYQHLREGVRYPRVYVTTNTKDDRVHPGHARKFAARLDALGQDNVYFEDTAGGHSYDADPLANARRWARHYVYLAQQLMD
jgi:prolyl oligopeptidase